MRDVSTSKVVFCLSRIDWLAAGIDIPLRIILISETLVM